MRNPWKDTPMTGDFVLPMDEEFVMAHNLIYRRKKEHQIDLRLPPAPFFGLHDAPVVVLLANAGVYPDDLEIQLLEANKRMILESIASPNGRPFVDLSSDYAIPAKSAWWKHHTRDLAAVVGGYDELSRKILAIELHGYHSKKWSPPLANFPSQKYSFHLVEQAIARGALIVTARCRDYWLAAVPKLATYSNVIKKTKSPRAAHLSRGNLSATDFAKLVRALRSQG